MPESLIDQAISLGERGYYVIPMRVWRNTNGEHEKLPLIGWVNGIGASKDPSVIRNMTTKFGDPAWDEATHIAVACEPSGIVVVDIDPYFDEEADDRVEGDRLIREWRELAEENGEEPLLAGDGDPSTVYDPPWVTTISNGVHVYLKADPSKPLSNSVKDITPCIDIRGVGGLIVLYYPEIMPPAAELPMMPEWLYAMARESSVEETTPVAPPEQPKYNEGEAGTSYGLSALQAELDGIQTAWEADDGTFNRTLNRHCFAVGQLAGGGELDPADAHEALRGKLAELGAPSSQYKTVDSGFLSGFDRPRSRKTKILEETEITEEEISAFMGKCLSPTGLDALPPPQWLIPGWLELNSISQVVGPSGSGKTFIALDMAARLSRGLGWPTPENTPAQPVKVAYVVAESVGGFGERKRAWETQHGPVANMIFYPDSIQIMAHEWRVAIEAFRRWRPSIIVVDTQARCTVGVNENEAKEMGQVVARVNQLREATGACVLLVHHTGKSNETARGSNAVLGALETEIMVTRTRDGRIKVVNTKQKNASEAGKIFFDLLESGPSVVPMPSAPPVTPEGMEGIERSTIKMQVRQYLAEQHVPRTTNEIFDGIDARSRPRVVTALNELCSTGEVTKTTELRSSRNQSVYLWNPPS